MNASTQPVTTALAGPSPALEIAADMSRRGLMAAPIAVLVGAAIWGLDGATSVAYGLAIVLVNFLLAAAILGWSARISFSLVMVASLLGFFMRLGLVFIAVIAVRDQSWVELVALSLTLVISHLGLLAWEVRFVSGSLAFPALAPNTPFNASPSSNPSPLEEQS